jgi:hypothetical protein
MEVDVTVIGIPPQPAVGCVRSVWEAARLIDMKFRTIAL